MNPSRTIINRSELVTAIVLLYLSGVIVLAAALAPYTVFAQSAPAGVVPNGPPPGPALSVTQISASTNKTCILTPSLIRLVGTPQQTEGPYFVDGMPNRSDIRSDPSDCSIQQGIPLHLVIHVYDVDNGSCNPLRGARVDIWHANSQGIYSSVNEQGTTGKKFLRGYQITDSNGTVRFTTIYPGSLKCP